MIQHDRTIMRAKRVLGIVICANFIPTVIAYLQKDHKAYGGFLDIFFNVWMFQLGIIGLILFAGFVAWLFGAFEE